MTSQRIGSHYLLHEQIGQGGMGTVWRAEDTESGAQRAVKVLKPEYARDPSAVARFVRERSALTALSHPNVVTLHDMIVEGDRLALVMDLLTEGDLDQLRRGHGGTLPPALAADITAQICDALAAAHARGIVHRDLKPGNVLLDGGRARLTDFGIARIGGEAAVTTPGTVLGTVSYMAPEALRGANPEPACDMYAAGITLHELLAGRPPFTGQAAVVIHDHLHKEPPPPDGASPYLRNLVAACLAKDPAARPTAAQLATALRQPQAAAEAAPAAAGARAKSAWQRSPQAQPADPWSVPQGPLTGSWGAQPAAQSAAQPGAPQTAVLQQPGAQHAGNRGRTWGIAAAAAALVLAGGGIALAESGKFSPQAATGTATSSAFTGQAGLAAAGHRGGPGKDRSKTGAKSRSAAVPLAGKTVTNLQITMNNPATSGSSGSVQVTWNQVAGATSYKVYMPIKGSFITDRTLANEGGLPAGAHQIQITPEPGGAPLSVSFTTAK